MGQAKRRRDLWGQTGLAAPAKERFTVWLPRVLMEALRETHGRVTAACLRQGTPAPDEDQFAAALLMAGLEGLRPPKPLEPTSKGVDEKLTAPKESP